MMNIASWNIRGINHPSKQSEIRHLIVKQNIGLLAVLEAKLKGDDCCRVDRNYQPNNDWKSLNIGLDSNGKFRVVLLWDLDIFSIRVLFSDTQIAICEVRCEKEKFCAAFLYAYNRPVERVCL
ncbi:hypothetical protein QQ045_004310 [Rhodiola kirilowii]